MLNEKSGELLNQPIELWKNNKSFQESVRRRYNINNNALLYDNKILLLLYTYEWFSIPSYMLYDKVSYHPLVGKMDIEKLNIIYETQKNIFLISIVPFYGILYFIKSRYAKGSNYRKNWKVYVTLGLIGITYPTVLWNYYFANRMNRKINYDADLSKFLTLDVDKEKIKLDLLNFNIVL